jgi:hypothetical protein
MSPGLISDLAKSKEKTNRRDSLEIKGSQRFLSTLFLYPHFFGLM